ncbi:EamA family transporter [bacterium]|nr:EamA family transporter [bacterium]
MADEVLAPQTPAEPSSAPAEARARHRKWQQMAGLAFLAQGLAGVTQKGLTELPGEYRVFFLWCTYVVAALLSYVLFRRRGGCVKPAAIVIGTISGTTCVLSVYFLLTALKRVGGVVVFSVIPALALALTLLAGWLVFQERLSRQQTWGVLLALVGIILVQL